MSNQIRFFEDYQIGQEGKTVTRTVTTADLVIRPDVEIGL